MKKTAVRLYLCLIVAAWLAAGLVAGCSDFPYTSRHQGPNADHSRWGDWSNASLEMMIEKYGPPARIETKRVVWENRHPWKRIVVWDEVVYRHWNAGADNIEQTVSYVVPEDKRRAVEALSERVSVSPDGTELSSRASSEEDNILALNLADEIVRGFKRTEEAKEFYRSTRRLASAGKSSPYMRKILFSTVTYQ